MLVLCTNHQIPLWLMKVNKLACPQVFIKDHSHPSWWLTQMHAIPARADDIVFVFRRFFRSIDYSMMDDWNVSLLCPGRVLTEFETCRVFFHKQALQPQICFDFRPKHDHFFAGTAYSRNLNPAYHDHKISNFADMDSLLLYQESRYSNWVEMIGGFIGIVRDQFVENIPDKIWLFEYLRTELM